MRLKHITEEIFLEDWIHDVQFLVDAKAPQLAVITAHNSLIFWSTDEQKIKSISCSENCILYSGSIIYHDANVIILAVGTVFQQILLWSPNSVSETSNGKLPFHRLKGHQGVIFSVTFSKINKLICSTSDDRSLRLWKIQCDLPVAEFSLEFWEKSSISLVSILYSHESRVWTSSILPSCIISVGEVRYICFALKKGFYAFMKHPSALHCRQSSTKVDFLRSLSLLTNNETSHIMVNTDQGYLSFYDLKHKLWVNAHMDDSYASFCVSSVSFQSKYVALGNICGDLTIFDFEGWSCGKPKIKKLKVHQGKICALHWVNKPGMNLLTCGLKGQMILWKIQLANEDIEINCLQKLHLPKCKQHWWSTVALYTNDFSYLIVGDRRGNLNLYLLLDAANIQEINPCKRLSGIHGDSGVTDLQEKNSLIYSSGKDGKVVVYSLENHSLNVLNTVKMPHNLEWIGRMMFYKEELLLLGFYTKYFIVWSSQLESAVLNIECGGGHRSWDFFLKENGKATFVAIKKKDIIYYEENLEFALHKAIIKHGISGQEFTCCCYLFTTNNLPSKSMSVFACGGEDTTLRVIGICSLFISHSTKTSLLSLCNLSGHLSSIRSIAKAKMWQENAYLLISVGGRSQMKIWRITHETKIANQPLVHYFVTGATDGELKIIYHEYKNDHSSHNSCTYNHELVFRVQLHKSGINAVDYLFHIAENIWLVCCGGDDNALTAILLDFKPTLQNETQIEILSRTLVSDAHASQITGIKFLGSKMLASVSIDQRLNIWHWNLNNGKLEISLRNSAMSLIPDISQMDCWPKSSTSWNAIICGQGIEYFNIENSKSNE
ncbi:WD repeat-containing protein 6-like [Uloborus diversus]|uniref:WD repeat-containing protein 6-like n=1 Tax=Uloborus diversus TaxID=327109 RepID=UPI002409AD03|nr:WD repeat-containing protein 6-like [Uloborus diversus]